MTTKTGSNWIDITVPLKEGMAIWPGDVTIKIERRRSMDRGDAANNSAISLGVHTGTHMDAPKHFIKDGRSIDKLPLETSVGPARVIEIKDKISIKPEELKQHNIKKGERILFKTVNSPRCWQTDAFVNDFVFVTRDAAQFLVDAGVILIGVDYLSVGSPLDPEKTMRPDTHQILLGAGLYLIEGLNLTVDPARKKLVAAGPLPVA